MKPAVLPGQTQPDPEQPAVGTAHRRNAPDDHDRGEPVIGGRGVVRRTPGRFGRNDMGALTAFIAYIMQILLAIMMAMYVLTTAPRAAACAERINAVLNTHPAVADP